MENFRPNILIFMTDHQRFDTAPPFNRAITPNLDRFYEKAIAFTNTYCPSPHCCPSRASFFSGLYPSEHGVWNNVNVGNALSRGPYENIRMWSEDLRESGYKMFFSGKWHVSSEEGPLDYGFEYVKEKRVYSGRNNTYTLPSNREWSIYTKDYKKEKNSVDRASSFERITESEKSLAGQILSKGYPPYIIYGNSENPFNDEEVVTDGLNMLNMCMNEVYPWCLYIGTLGPHDPYFVPERFLNLYKDIEIEIPESFYDEMSDKPSMYKRIKQKFSQLDTEEHKECLKHYLAFCSYEDFLFGKIYDRLIETGQIDNTIIFYLSDHGDYAGEHGLWAKGLPCFNGAYHIPFLVGGYNIKEGKRTIDEFVSLTDFAPTILELAGIHFEDNRFSGKSILPFINGEKVSEFREAVFTQTNGNELYGIQRSVMTKSWKYIYNGFDYDELYDLENDPNQMFNLADKDKYDGIQKHLSELLWKFAYEHKDVCISPYVMVSIAKYGPGVAFGWE